MADEILPVAATGPADSSVVGKRQRPYPSVGDTVTDDELASIIGPYEYVAGMEVPQTLTHKHHTWKIATEPFKLWPARSRVCAFFDTYVRTTAGQAGDFLARCRVCATSNLQGLYSLKSGQTSNAHKHFEIGAISRRFPDVQKERHTAVARHLARSSTAPSKRPDAGATGTGAIEPFLRQSGSRRVSPSEARPHNLRLAVAIVSSLAPHAMVSNAHVAAFVRGLGTAFVLPSRGAITELLVDLFAFVRRAISDRVTKARLMYKGLRFLHVVTDLWTERHGTGSYGSISLTYVDPSTMQVEELHLGVTPFHGAHTHDLIAAWVARRLDFFGIATSDICSATTDSGSNIRKAMLAAEYPWVPCAAHAVHNAVKAAVGGAEEAGGLVDETAMDEPRGRRSQNPGAKQLLQRTRKLSAHFDKSSKSTSMLNAQPLPEDAAPRRVPSDCPTRWRSTFLALCRLFSLSPKLNHFANLPGISEKVRELMLAPAEWDAVRHLLGVLQPAYEVCVAVQGGPMTVAEAFKFVCRWRRTMASDAFAVPCDFERPLAVGKDAIVRFLEEDKKQTDVIELDGRLYKFKDMIVTVTRCRLRLGEEARVAARILRREIDHRFFNTDDGTKNWLANDPVLAAVLLTPGGAVMLSKVSKWVGGADALNRAREVVMSACLSMVDEEVTDRDQQEALLKKRAQCRTTLVN